MKINVKLIMKIKMVKIVLIFTILSLVFASSVVFAQESSLLGQAPPTTSPIQVVPSSGAPFNVGWNYFTVSAAECTLKSIFNELQAAGGGALLVQQIWREENGGWKMFDINNAINIKINSDNIFAFNSNQKFYLSIAPDACKTNNANRDTQIQQVRDLSTRQKGDSFIEKLLSVPGDFWSGLFGKMEVNTKPDLSSNVNSSSQTPVFNTLNVLGKTIVNDLGITGNISSGLLSVDGLNGSINSLGELKLQDQQVAGINILNGKIIIDKEGNLISQSNITAKKYNVDTTDLTSNSLGSGILNAGTTSITVTTSAITDGSKIFITPISDTDKPLIVKNKITGKSFDVTILVPYASDIHFDWFIVN